MDSKLTKGEAAGPGAVPSRGPVGGKRGTAVDATMQRARKAAKGVWS